jgi:hypothetical protein
MLLKTGEAPSSAWATRDDDFQKPLSLTFSSKLFDRLREFRPNFGQPVTRQVLVYCTARFPKRALRLLEVATHWDRLWLLSSK